MPSKKKRFKVGDSVRFKDGQKDAESGINIGGWQGRITQISAKHEMLLVALDSVTLKSMSQEYLEDCEEEGLGWSEYYIGFDDVEPAQPRDTERDVKETITELSNSLAWLWLGGQEGRDMNAILADAGDDYEELQAWEKHLRTVLTFPFNAEVSEWQRRGSPLRVGQEVRVTKIVDLDEGVGILVRVKKGRRATVFPLCDLEMVPETSPNHDPVQLYAVWFANR